MVHKNPYISDTKIQGTYILDFFGGSDDIIACIANLSQGRCALRRELCLNVVTRSVTKEAD